MNYDCNWTIWLVFKMLDRFKFYFQFILITWENLWTMYVSQWEKSDSLESGSIGGFAVIDLNIDFSSRMMFSSSLDTLKQLQMNGWIQIKTSLDHPLL